MRADARTARWQTSRQDPGLALLRRGRHGASTRCDVRLARCPHRSRLFSRTRTGYRVHPRGPRQTWHVPRFSFTDYRKAWIHWCEAGGRETHGRRRLRRPRLFILAPTRQRHDDDDDIGFAVPVTIAARVSVSVYDHRETTTSTLPVSCPLDLFSPLYGPTRDPASRSAPRTLLAFRVWYTNPTRSTRLSVSARGLLLLHVA